MTRNKNIAFLVLLLAAQAEAISGLRLGAAAVELRAEDTMRAALAQALERLVTRLAACKRPFRYTYVAELANDRFGKEL